MSAYDEMPTGDLVAHVRDVAWVREGAHHEASALTLRAAANRLAAYERIVAALRDTGQPVEVVDDEYACVLCDARSPLGPVPGGATRPHDPECPWLLAQQTGSGK